MKRVVFVGGHLTPALAVLEELRKRGGWEFFWIGRKEAMEGKSVPSLEFQVIPKLGIQFFNLTTGRLQRKFTLETLPSLLKVPLGFFQAFLILSKIRPNLIVSFGGYLSIPVVILGWLLGIPSLIHEQTTTSGLSNRIAAWFAKKIAVSFATSAPDFPVEKTVLTGNPIRNSILNLKRQPAVTPVIYVTGGSQGAQVINRAVEEVLLEILKKARLVHQTGVLDFEYFNRLKQSLPYNLSKKYKVFANLLPDEVVQVLEVATVVVSRAGANTVAELAAVGIPSVLIPIPWVERGEQEKNARLLVEAGLSRVIEQDKLNGQLLKENIEYFLKNSPEPKIISAAKKLVRPKAASEIADIAEEIAK